MSAAGPLEALEALVAASECPAGYWRWSFYSRCTGRLMLTAFRKEGGILGHLVFRGPTHVRLASMFGPARFSLATAGSGRSSLPEPPGDALGGVTVRIDAGERTLAVRCREVAYYPRPRSE